MYIDDDELREIYQASSIEQIDRMEAALLVLEKKPDNLAPVKDILRVAHTLKGDSRMLGLEDIETLTHQVEECLAPIDRGEEQFTGELSDRIYRGMDVIRQLAIAAVTPNLVVPIDMFRELSSLMGANLDTSGPVIARSIPSLSELELEPELELELPELVAEVPASIGSDLFCSIDIPELRSDLPAGVEALSQLDDLLLPDLDSTRPRLDRNATVGDLDIVSPEPIDVPMLADDLPSAFLNMSPDDDLFLETFKSGDLSGDMAANNAIPNLAEEDLAILFPDLAGATGEDIPRANIELPDLEPVAVEPEPAAPQAAEAIVDIGKAAENIRVQTSQLDRLMLQAGEIRAIDRQLIGRSINLDNLSELWNASFRDYQQLKLLLAQLSESSLLLEKFDRSQQQWEAVGNEIERFKQSFGSDLSRLELSIESLESTVKEIRLVPMSSTINTLARMVRDLAKTQQKEIDFEVEGRDLLVDKHLLEQIRDPLMHILRNAVDHGIELPRERQMQGKNPTATLHLEARQLGDRISIEISDDGRGLDTERIKAKAIDRGMYTAEQIATMSAAQIQSLIFAAGFSTRSRITEISGRGVGLDIVKHAVEQLKGSVDVTSVQGQGTHFIISVSNAIGASEVLLVTSKDNTYALPLEFIDRMLLLDRAEVMGTGKSTVTIDGKMRTVVWLSDLLSLGDTVPTTASSASRTSRSIPCVLMQIGSEYLALLVDSILDRQQVTVKPLHALIDSIRYFTGATVLASGDVCLVLNPIDLLKTVMGEMDVNFALDPVNTNDSHRMPKILLVEDSLVIRKQMQRILTNAGYEVTVAVDGADGWEKLQAENFDGVVSDVEMPNLSGLELTIRIRQNSNICSLPIVLVTTLNKQWDRQAGIDAGANAYLTKGNFDQQLLLDTLTRLV